MKAYLANKCAVDGDIIAFNESMITGESCENIFSDTFFQARAKSLDVSYDEYAGIVITELDKLFKKSYSRINLWFDGDMFCQINMLTLLAYLDSVNYDGIVLLNIIRQDFLRYDDPQDMVIKSYDIGLGGYYSIYQEVIINKRFTGNNHHLFDELQEGIRLYGNYTSDNSEIRAAIRAMIKDDISEEDIVIKIMEAYPQYGVGDCNIKLLYNLEKGCQS